LSDRTPGILVGNLRLFADIVRLRKGPEDLPVSRPLLVYCVVASIAVRALAMRVLPMPFQGNPLAILLLDAGVTLLFVSLVLALAGRPERFLQTASAVFGYQLVMLPLMLGAGWLLMSYLNDAVWRMPVLLLNAALSLWSMVVVVRILRSATGWPLFACVAFAISGELLSLIILTSVFPSQAVDVLQGAQPAQAG
jgi:hypothetical protein